ncbi:acetyltransferase [Cocleimonas flava]|uniref:DHH family putative phosphoesterase n=1 Tax=Cocleimonas flava TaxID=634765 RepID=A0A4R1F7M4_9GAMM|nr:DHH family phosphoesterase [Cocleimonas flava]TCJ88629.1 DHH family putative phosphoesterase [Cocleimonas flava]
MNDSNNIDVFNGDADGICALIQFRLAHPAESTLVTGVKRDIKLLDRVSANKEDKINVFDISMEKNSSDVKRLLSEGASIFYVDHHMAGEIPNHTNLNTIIDTSPKTCTSLLVDDYLKGEYTEWAAVAAFGDNLNQSAEKTAQSLSINSDQLSQLKRLGISINYNGYGSSLDDLHFKPDDLYQKMVSYTSPLDFIEDTSSVYLELQAGYDNDIAQTTNLKAEIATPNIAVYKLPDEIWARRVSGVFGNQLANQYPERAHAILSNNPKGGYVVSVRAPLNNLEHASELCKQFPSGGGRKGAAGINQLPEGELNNFIDLLKKTYTH